MATTRQAAAGRVRVLGGFGAFGAFWGAWGAALPAVQQGEPGESLQALLRNRTPSGAVKARSVREPNIDKLVSRFW